MSTAATDSRPPLHPPAGRAGLHAWVTAIEDARETAYRALGEANARGLTGADLTAMADAMDAVDAAMAAAIASTRRKGVRSLFANSDGSVTAWYGGSRFRVIAL